MTTTTQEIERVLRIGGVKVHSPSNQDDPIAELVERLDQETVNKMAEIFADAFMDTLERAKAQGHPNCVDCDRVRTLGLFRKNCPLCRCQPYCDRHIKAHIATFHKQTPLHQHMMLELTNKLMLTSFMTGYHTEQASHTLTRHNNKSGTREGAQAGRSPWYGYMKHFGLTGVITTWQVPEDQNDQKRLQKAIEDFKAASDLRTYFWTTASKGIVLFMADKTALNFLPQDITLPQVEQESDSGFQFSPRATPGKIGKRAKTFSHAEGAFFVPNPSTLGTGLRLPDGRRPLQIKIKDTSWIGTHQMGRGAGDGNGRIRETAAYRLMKNAGITKRRDQVFGLQINLMGADFFGKGILLVRPDQEFPLGVDIEIDSDSISTQLLNSRFTFGRIIPKRNKQNCRHIYIEPLMQAVLIDKFLDPAEMAKHQTLIAKKLDKEQYGAALLRELLPPKKNEAPETEPSERYPERPEDIHLRAATSTEFASGMTDISSSTGGLWSSPLAMKRLVGGLSSEWSARLAKASPTAGRIVSGEKVWLMHYAYAGEFSPYPGYARFVWKGQDQLQGICFNKRDAERFEQSLDSSDCDDQLSLVFMHGTDGKPKVLILKLPMSIEGGTVLNINQEDAQKLKQWYHFYQQKGDKLYPGMHDTDEAGNPLYPDVLHPGEIPERDKLHWRTQEDKAVEFLIQMHRFHGVTGMVANLVAALDYSGLWTPEVCKFNLSEAVIDRVANADADPRKIAEDLTKILYGYVRAGKPIDTCMLGRVSGMLNRHHTDKHGEDAPKLIIAETCRHEQRIEAYTKDTLWLEKRERRRELAANGSPEWLGETFSEDIVTAVLEAKKTRDAAFNARYHADREARQTVKEEFIDEFGEIAIVSRPAYKKAERNILLALNMERARLREREAVEDAYVKVQGHPDYQPGQFHALWNLISLRGLSRGKSRYEDSHMKAVSVYALATLPDEEHLAFYGRGVAEPMIPLRPYQKQEELEANRTLTLKADGNNKWGLFDPETGDPVLKLKVDARNYTDTSLSVTSVQYLPQMEDEPEITTGESILMVRINR